MSSWINLKRMETEMGRGGWEWISVHRLSPATVTATMGSVTAQHGDSGHGYVWHGAEQFPSEATDQECCSAHRATKMYEIALAEKQDFWVLSQKGFFPLLDECSPLIEQQLPSFFPTWKWLLELIMKGRIFYNPIRMESLFSAPEGSSLTGYLELFFSPIS